MENKSEEALTIEKSKNKLNLLRNVEIILARPDKRYREERDVIIDIIKEKTKELQLMQDNLTPLVQLASTETPEQIMLDMQYKEILDLRKEIERLNNEIVVMKKFKENEK